MSFPTGRLPDGTWVVADGTERDAIGSNDGLAAGDRAWNQTDDEYDLCESVDGADSSTWSRKRLWTLEGAYSTGSTAERFPFLPDGSSIGTSVTDVRVSTTMPHAGQGVAFYWHPENDAGSTEVFFYKNKTGPAISSATVSVDTTQGEFNATGLTWSAGDSIAIGVDPNNAPTNPMWTFVYEVDLLT